MTLLGLEWSCLLYMHIRAIVESVRQLGGGIITCIILKGLLQLKILVIFTTKTRGRGLLCPSLSYWQFPPSSLLWQISLLPPYNINYPFCQLMQALNSLTLSDSQLGSVWLSSCLTEQLFCATVSTGKWNRILNLYLRHEQMLKWSVVVDKLMPVIGCHYLLIIRNINKINYYLFSIPIYLVRLCIVIGKYQGRTRNI